MSELEDAVRAGAAALQNNDPLTARGQFERVIATGRANVQVWMLQAMACRGLGDTAAEEAAVDAALKADPNNIRMLVMKGERREGADDPRAASSFYSRAVSLASGRQLPGDLRTEVDRAGERVTALAQRFQDDLETTLADAGFPADARPPRFQEAIDILNGKKQVYLQQPSALYYPQLPQRQYYEREEFDWVAALEAETPAILAELSALLETEEGFAPYLTSDPSRPRHEFHGMHDNPEWSTLYLHEHGGPVEAHVERCPRTWAAMQKLPLCRITTRAPTIMFSLLRAGAKIPAHTGTINTRLICHLPLVVPPKCGFRVGNETREWEVGKLLMFDDTIEHEAWNDSDQDRVVLIFDVWRPELSDAERAAVAAIFAGIDRG